MMAVISEETIVNEENETTPPRRRTRSTTSNKRTRTGCLNCRRKRRKCDERKPTCEGCQSRSERCEWGVKVSFRPEHASTIGLDHPSMRQGATSGRTSGYKIIDVTPEVIRDYLEESVDDSMEDIPTVDATPSTNTPQLLLDLEDAGHNMPPNAFQGLDQQTPPISSHSDILPDPMLDAPHLFLSPHYSDPAFEDGIFLPGSQYQELHATLRSRLIDTAKSTVPSRIGSPDLQPYTADAETAPADSTEDEEFQRLANLSLEQEFVLWQNYIDEVAGWMDKFDINRHFELVLPIMAKSHPHLRYSLLALSAAQMERKAQSTDNSCSLALYQHAIHLLSPLLQQRTTAVLASCVVLCVLEMMSCSPKAWRRHLDGCAALIQALGVSGGCGGLEQALFWCFARMDLWGGLISSEKTLIPMHNWIGGGSIVDDVALLANVQGNYDMYANHVVYLCGQVIELLCSSGKWEQRHQPLTDLMTSTEYLNQWTRLFELLDQWYLNRPEEMTALLTVPSPPGNSSKPFHTLLYGNGPATSGNQMYHTAALLMLKYKPSHVVFRGDKKPPSMLWHARQVCAISFSNRHHGCWTNSIQPLWIAGQHMSHPSEHRAILEIYGRIEREIGWATRWRAEDLREYWGVEED